MVLFDEPDGGPLNAPSGSAPFLTSFLNCEWPVRAQWGPLIRSERY